MAKFQEILDEAKENEKERIFNLIRLCLSNKTEDEILKSIDTNQKEIKEMKILLNIK